jgi:hypothetical protein
VNWGKDSECPLPTWESLNDIQAKNYQRSASEKMENLEYRPRGLSMKKEMTRTVKMLQCVKSEDVNWQVTFGLVDKFLYLIEPYESQDNKNRISAIVEPDALEFEESKLSLQLNFLHRHKTNAGDYIVGLLCLIIALRGSSCFLFGIVP